MVATVETRATQAYTLTAIQLNVDERTTQLFGRVLAQTTTPLRTSQAYCLVLIKSGAEYRTLRAWTFTQDDHDFYVLQLGTSMTAIYDKLTGQWCQWQSSGVAIWNGQDGCDWDGVNVCCDPNTGQIYQIDPTNRLDNNNTPIVSQVFAYVTARLRKIVPIYLAEVAISEGRPPAGIDPTTVGIKMRTSDTVNGWIDHGTVAGVANGSMLFSRFYGLGVAQYPGILVEITDSGYARRIDGLTVELGAEVAAPGGA